MARGIYVPASARITEHHSLVEATTRVPGGVICLLSALGFHGLGTQLPHEVWMAIGRNSRLPARGSLPLRFFLFSGKAWTYGVEVHVIEGVEVRITSKAKTVADCFKFRNAIGLDVAIEALKAYLSQRGRSMDDLVAAAEVCRVNRVMMPYIEAMT